MSVAEVVTLVISLLSLSVSAWTLFRTQLSPFKLSVAGGTPTWRMGQLEPNTATITIPIALVNDGARLGIVRDMVVDLVRDGAADRFIPGFVVDASKYAEDIAVQDSTLLAKAPMFHPIILLGRQQIAKAIVFLPEEPSAVTLGPGRYSVTLNVQADGVNSLQRSWASHYLGSFQLVKDDLATMKQGIAVEKVSDEIRSDRIPITTRR